jgi:hypothetical protein
MLILLIPDVRDAGEAGGESLADRLLTNEPGSPRVRSPRPLAGPPGAASEAGARRSNPHELVFTTSRGTSPTAWALWCAFVDATKAAGVRPIRIHDLRHACATLLLTAGEELAVISKVLGHADYSTTLRVYAHRTPSAPRRQPGGSTPHSGASRLPPRRRFEIPRRTSFGGIDSADPKFRQ